MAAAKRKKKQTKKNAPPKKPSVSAPLTKRKLWVYRLMSVVLVPALFFGTLEAGLRWLGYGYCPRAIIKQKLNDKDIYCQNYRFGWRFFPHSIARHFDGFVFDTQKAPETYRIFVLGASAAAGIPAPAYNFGHMLEVMLDESYPEMDFEVLTVAMPAINSHVVLEIAKDCARYQPDLFIVYLGNNEIVGPYGPSTVFAPLSPNLSMIRANIALKSMRLGQLFDAAMQTIAPRSGTPQQWNGLEMFLEKQIRYDDPALEITYQHFERNLRDICQTGIDAGASVIVSTVCSNLRDCPPFASLHRADLTDADKQTWQGIYRQGIAFQAEGHIEQAIEKYLEAEKIDDRFAELQFRLGQCYWDAGDFQKAGEKYIQAREYDTLRLRADNRINEIIRNVAADTEREDPLYFADSLRAFEADSPHRIPGQDLFYEHVHMTFKGNFLLARSLLPYVQKTLPPEQQTVATRSFSEKDGADLIGYTAYERAVYLNLVYESYYKRPPFTNQLNNEQLQINTKRSIDAQLLNLKRTGLDGCLTLHKAAVQNRPDDWQVRFQYAAFLNSGLHDIKAEEVQLREVIKRCPYYAAYLNLGINLHSQGKIKESESALHDVLEINPNAVVAHIELASICRQRKEYEKEIQHLRQALSLEPESLIRLHLDLAKAYEQTGKPDKAIEILENAITVFPEEETANVHALLSRFLYARSEYTQALKEIQHAFRIDPTLQNNPSYNTLLQNLQNRQAQ
jgi:tetratricopeptide (TPR) repeat protein